MLVNSLAS